MPTYVSYIINMQKNEFFYSHHFEPSETYLPLVKMDNEHFDSIIITYLIYLIPSLLVYRMEHSST